MTTHALTAKAIRTELKSSFPGIKFSVTSESFSMGNAVNVSWTDGPLTKEVDSIVNQYRYGHFDGMNDMYEMSNVKSDLPQVKFVSTSRNMSDDSRAAIAQEIGVPNDNGYNADRGDYNGILIRQVHSQRKF